MFRNDNMASLYLLNILSSLKFETIKFKEELSILKTPFTDFQGDPIEVGYSIKENKLLMNDLGRIAGELFLMDRNKESSKSLKFVKNICKEYGINVDYNLGQLNQEVDLKDSESARNFIKIIVTLLTVLPYIEK